MQKAKIGAMVGLLGLGLTSGAQAWSPFGQGEVEEKTYAPEALGYDLDSQADLPAFQNFVYGAPGQPLVNAAFGMAYRTHRHLRQRELHGSSGSDAGIPLSHRLGRDHQRGRPKAELRAVMVNDSLTHFTRTSFYTSGTDLVANLQARLRGKDVRQLVFCIESPNGLRRRYLFLYKAIRAEDGFWTCEFYDPHLSPGDAHRTSTLEISEKTGLVLVNRGWAEHVNPQDASEDLLLLEEDSPIAVVPSQQFGIADSDVETFTSFAAWTGYGSYTQVSAGSVAQQGADAFLGDGDQEWKGNSIAHLMRNSTSGWIEAIRNVNETNDAAPIVEGTFDSTTLHGATE